MPCMGICLFLYFDGSGLMDEGRLFEGGDYFYKR